jgi:hypothetical protein
MKKPKKQTKTNRITITEITPLNQKFHIKKGKYHVFVELNKGHYHLLSKGNQGYFMFKSASEKETIKRWRTIIELMNEAVDFIDLHGKL